VSGRQVRPGDERDRRSGPLIAHALQVQPKVRLVQISGDMERLKPRGLQGLIDQQLTTDPRLLILDLTRVTALGYDGVRVLVRTAEWTGVCEIGLCLITNGALVGTALSEAGVFEIFELHDSVAEALRTLK
jgi:anti-anti-sigma regulatory factor